MCSKWSGLLNAASGFCSIRSARRLGYEPGPRDSSRAGLQDFSSFQPPEFQQITNADERLQLRLFIFVECSLVGLLIEFGDTLGIGV
jgi:hypothetical protein